MKIGLLGLGTVGSGVYRIIENCRKKWEQKYREEIIVKSVSVKNLRKKREIVPFDTHITGNPFEIAEDPEIDTVIELIGGEDPAFELMMRSMQNGKNLITGNKAVVSEHFPQLVETAARNKVHFGYEASVCGGIPIIKTLSQLKIMNDINSVKGIMNGTTNYILDKMSREKLEYSQSLEQAQKLGYAEADPTADVEGFDARRKLAILCSIAYDIHLKPEAIPCRGISKITSRDVNAVKHMGYVPKLFACARKNGDTFNACVEPVLVEKSDVFASIPGAKNMVALNGNYIGELQLDGEGAGMFPTANAVVSDLLDILGKNSPDYPEFGIGRVGFKGLSGIAGRYYVRISPDNDTAIGLLLKKLETEGIECKIFKDRGDLIAVTGKIPHKSVQNYMEDVESQGWPGCFMRIMD